ncbi:MAG: hypothetical protein OJF47_001795 [Nitrospira sp.]|nr:MAG: hypothetical protein OJF47_001795 [Nitrospira sp.]
MQEKGELLQSMDNGRYLTSLCDSTPTFSSSNRTDSGAMHKDRMAVGQGSSCPDTDPLITLHKQRAGGGIP